MPSPPPRRPRCRRPSSTSIPTWEAIAFCDATMPFFARTGTEAAEPVAAGASASDSDESEASVASSADERLPLRRRGVKASEKRLWGARPAL